MKAITIEWDIVPTLSAQAALKQATLDLITYRFTIAARLICRY